MTVESKMKTQQEVELRAQIRTNKTARKEVGKQFSEIKEKKEQLKQERVGLLAQAEKLGIQFGEKAKA